MQEKYIPGYDPKTGIRIQETSFGTRAMLERLRDEFDKPLAVFFARGNSNLNLPSLGTIVVDLFIDQQAKYLEGNIVDLYALITDALVRSFELAITHKIINRELAISVFAVAASEGIDTAVANVLLSFPFEKGVTSLQKIDQDNDRFKNRSSKEPKTGERAFKICPGFRTAQAIEQQLIISISSILSNNSDTFLFDNTIPRTESVGDLCKSRIESL